MNEFLKQFKKCQQLISPLSEDVINEFIAESLYRKASKSIEFVLYREFDPEEIHRMLARKGKTLKHLWKKCNTAETVEGQKPLKYCQYCSLY